MVRMVILGTLELTANTPMRAVVVAKPPAYLSFKSVQSWQSKFRQASDANETSKAFLLIPPVCQKQNAKRENCQTFHAH